MFKLLGLLSLVIISTAVSATEVAVIDFRAALLQSKQGLAASVEPRQQVQLMEQRLQSAEAELSSIAAELKKDELTLSTDEYQQRRQALAQRENAVRNMAANMQREAQKLEQKLIDDLSPQGEVVLKALIEEKKLDLVLNRQLSLYANGETDLTAEFIKRLNEIK